MVHPNVYPGQDEPVKQASLRWHDEKIIDQQTPIIGVSFGEPMRVRFKSIVPGSKAVELLTRDGQVYAMTGSFQSEFVHCVAPLTETGPRSLVFWRQVTLRGTTVHKKHVG
jgi:alkylated DNA repair dioxygenase AlkB